MSLFLARRPAWVRHLARSPAYPPPPAVGRRNQEFLPAHLEILARPASPYAGAFVWLVGGMVAAAVAWSCVARIDIYAVASGRVQPDGRSKIVQPLDTSRVTSVAVRNGAIVKARDLLIQLDDTQAQATFTAAQSDLASLEAQIERRKAVIEAIRSGRATLDPHGIDTVLRGTERAAMQADFARYLATRSTLTAELDEKTATEDRFTASMAARNRLLAALRQRESMRQTLVQMDAGTKAALIDATQQVEQTSADLAYDTGQLAEATAAKRSLQRKIEELAEQTLAEQTELLTDAVEKQAPAEEKLTSAKVKLEQTRLRAPIDGTVQQLAVTTVGQVVTAGQPLLVVVPSGAAIEVAATLASRDIGFVREGQAAVIKIDALPFVRYGSVDGRVTQVSRDAVDLRDTNGSTDALSSTRSGINEVGGTPSTQNLMYQVAVTPAKTSIRAEGRDVPLAPGMTATVEIRTGDRRVIDYLLSPILESVTTAGHER